MTSDWASIALYALLPLAIVPLVLIGRLLPNGAITATSGAAVIALSVFFTFFNGGYGLVSSQTSGASVIVWLLGLLLLFAAWTLAFTDAAQGRRWRWLIPLTVTAYLSFAALIALVALPDPCLLAPGQPIGVSDLQCGAPDQTAHLLTLIGCYIGPLTTLLYSLRDTLPRRQPRPAGAAVSPLRAEGGD
jgi:hypothetical protein